MNTPLRLVAASVLLVISAALADSAGVKVVRERYFPEGWTEPEVTSTAGSKSYKPSVADGFRKQNIGGVLNVDNASAHRTATPKALVDAERRTFKMNLRLSNGHSIPVNLNRWVRVGDDWLRVTLRKDGYYYLESKSRKESWRMQRMPE